MLKHTHKNREKNLQNSRRKKCRNKKQDYLLLYWTPFANFRWSWAPMGWCPGGVAGLIGSLPPRSFRKRDILEYVCIIYIYIQRFPFSSIILKTILQTFLLLLKLLYCVSCIIYNWLFFFNKNVSEYKILASFWGRQWLRVNHSTITDCLYKFPYLSFL